MPAIAIRGEESKCHKCNKIDILDGHGLCVECYDKIVDNWIPPIYKHKPRRKKEWDTKYYKTHRQQCIQRSVIYHRHRRLQYPELLIKDRERSIKYREAHRHPCADCGKPCNRESTRCRNCYVNNVLKTPNNPARGFLKYFWEEKTHAP